MGQQVKLEGRNIKKEKSSANKSLKNSYLAPIKWTKEFKRIEIISLLFVPVAL